MFNVPHRYSHTALAEFDQTDISFSLTSPRERKAADDDGGGSPARVFVCGCRSTCSRVRTGTSGTCSSTAPGAGAMKASRGSVL